MVGNVMAAKTLSINQTVNGASCGLNQAPLSIDIENFPLSLPRNFGQKVLSNNMTTFWQVGHVTNTLDIIRAVHWVNVEMLHFIRIVVFAHYVLINIHIRECFNDTYWSGGPPTPQLRPTPFRLLFSSAARNRHNLGTIFNSTVAPDATNAQWSSKWFLETLCFLQPKCSIIDAKYCWRQYLLWIQFWICPFLHSL